MEILIYETKCSLCGLKMQDPAEEALRTKLVSHIDNECAVATTIRDWGREGIYKDMIGLLRLESLDKVLRRLLKKYSAEEIRRALETIER